MKRTRPLMATLLLIALLTNALMVAAQQDDAEEIDLTPPTLGDFDVASVSEIALEDYPVVPDLTDHARDIYTRGIENGNNPQSFAKVGDCMTASNYFMAPFSTGEFTLGGYEADLQDVVDYFAEAVALETEAGEISAFENIGQATASGFNTASVLDAIWANPNFCDQNETPLACEYRLVNPAFSVIMFGTNDVMFIEEASFDFYLRSVVLETINADIVPILSTIPTRPEFPEKTITYNQIIISIAQDYDLPLMNLWLGLQDLPNEGVDPLEPIHLSIPTEISTGDLTETGLEWGYNYRNLITLKTFDTLLTALAEDPAE